MTLPAAGGESEINEWLQSIDGIEHRVVNETTEYFLKETTQRLTTPLKKRKNTSPLPASSRQSPKRPFVFMAPVLERINVERDPTTPQAGSSRPKLPTTAKKRLQASRRLATPNLQTPKFQNYQTSTAKKDRPWQPRVVDKMPRKRVRIFIGLAPIFVCQLNVILGSSQNLRRRDDR